jgi:hypothetical protein
MGKLLGYQDSLAPTYGVTRTAYLVGYASAKYKVHLKERMLMLLKIKVTVAFFEGIGSHPKDVYLLRRAYPRNANG